MRPQTMPEDTKTIGNTHPSVYRASAHTTAADAVGNPQTGLVFCDRRDGYSGGMRPVVYGRRRV